jgi:hypothetical protein
VVVFYPIIKSRSISLKIKSGWILSIRFFSIVLATATYTKLSLGEERASASLYRREGRLALKMMASYGAPVFPLMCSIMVSMRTSFQIWKRLSIYIIQQNGKLYLKIS